MSEFINLFLLMVSLVSLMTSAVVAAVAVVVKKHIVKRTIALTIFSDTIALLMAFTAYRMIEGVAPPVRFGQSLTDVDYALETFVDPVPHALVVTSLVIGLAFTLFIAFTAERMYSELRTVDLRKALTFVEGEPEPEEGTGIE